MFIDYLDDEKVYLELEKYWVDFFLNIIGKHREDDWIIPYYQTTFANEKKFMDGNPIFSAKSKFNDKSVRIVQESSDDFDGIKSWIDANQKNELVIICSLSKKNLEKVKEVIVTWLII